MSLFVRNRICVHPFDEILFFDLVQTFFRHFPFRSRPFSECSCSQAANLVFSINTFLDKRIPGRHGLATESYRGVLLDWLTFQAYGAYLLSRQLQKAFCGQGLLQLHPAVKIGVSIIVLEPDLRQWFQKGEGRLRNLLTWFVATTNSSDVIVRALALSFSKTTVLLPSQTMMYAAVEVMLGNFCSRDANVSCRESVASFTGGDTKHWRRSEEIECRKPRNIIKWLK